MSAYLLFSDFFSYLKSKCIVAANDFENWSAPSFDADKHHVPSVRQADIDNHNLEGGFWVVIDGNVYDISHLKSRYMPQQVEQCIRKCILLINN